MRGHPRLDRLARMGQPRRPRQRRPEMRALVVRPLVQPQGPQRGQGHRPRARHRRGRQRVAVPRDQPRVHLSGGEALVTAQAPQEGEVGRHPRHLRARQGPFQGVQRRAPRGPVRHHLGDHGVVPRADGIALPHPRLDPRVAEAQAVQRAGLRQEPRRRILRVEPRLEGMPRDRQILLRHPQPLARGHAQHPLHEVHAGDRLCDGVLHLQAGVHLHEVEAVGAQALGGVHDELHRARAAVADRLRRAHRRGAHRVPHLRRHARRGGLLDHLLVAPLERAVPLEQVHRPATVAEHLHLDVARRGDQLLDQHAVVAEGLGRLRARRLQRVGELGLGVDRAHPLAAAARHGLDQHGPADVARRLQQDGVALVLALVARHHGHARLDHRALGGVLEAHRADRLGRRADEDEARRLHRLHEAGVLRQEAVARMDRLRPRGLRGGDHRVAAQVALGRGAPAQRDRGVGHRDVARVRVDVGMDRDRADAEAAAGVDDAAGDLAAVGDQDRAEHAPPCRARRPGAMIRDASSRRAAPRTGSSPGSRRGGRSPRARPSRRRAARRRVRRARPRGSRP